MEEKLVVNARIYPEDQDNGNGNPHGDNPDEQQDLSASEIQSDRAQLGENVTPTERTPVQCDTPPNQPTDNHNPLSHDENLSKLWKKAINADDLFAELVYAMKKGDRKPSKSVGLGVSLVKCALDEVDILRYRHQLWIPKYEPLRTGILAKVHDNILNGYPGKETMFALF